MFRRCRAPRLHEHLSCRRCRGYKAVRTLPPAHKRLGFTFAIKFMTIEVTPTAYGSLGLRALEVIAPLQLSLQQFQSPDRGRGFLYPALHGSTPMPAEAEMISFGWSFRRCGPPSSLATKPPKRPSRSPRSMRRQACLRHHWHVGGDAGLLSEPPDRPEDSRQSAPPRPKRFTISEDIFDKCMTGCHR